MSKEEDSRDDTGWYDMTFLASARPEFDARDVSPRVLAESMTAHHVSGGAFTTEEHSVHRHCTERHARQKAEKEGTTPSAVGRGHLSTKAGTLQRHLHSIHIAKPQ